MVRHRLSLKQANHPSKPTQERQLALSTIHQELRSFKTFGVWLAENGHKDPFAGLKRPKLPRHLIDRWPSLGAAAGRGEAPRGRLGRDADGQPETASPPRVERPADLRRR